jgi:hypothetical protein
MGMCALPTAMEAWCSTVLPDIVFRALDGVSSGLPNSPFFREQCPLSEAPSTPPPLFAMRHMTWHTICVEVNMQEARLSQPWRWLLADDTFLDCMARSKRSQDRARQPPRRRARCWHREGPILQQRC